MKLAIPSPPAHASWSWPVAVAGAVLLIVSGLLSWSYNPGVLGDLSIYLYPGSIQILALVLAAVALVALLAYRGPLRRLGEVVVTDRMALVLGIGAVVYMTIVIATIAVVSNGLVNVEPGGWVGFVGAVLLAVGSWALPARKTRSILRAETPGWFDILVIVVMLAISLFGAAFALAQDQGSAFVLFLVFAATLAAALAKGQIFIWLGLVAERHRHVITLGAFVVAFLFPFTQNGSDVNMSIASQVLIFAATALGLNIVVGLAGLLDLGYIAFLGAGA